MNSTLQEHLRTAVLETVGSLRVSPMSASLVDWGVDDVRIIQTALDFKLVTKDEIADKLDCQLRKLGRSAYIEHITLGNSPDHTLLAETFAYALYVGEFSSKEEQKIQFDHGETVSQFVVSYGGAKLKVHLMQKIVPPKKVPEEQPVTVPPLTRRQKQDIPVTVRT